MEDSIDLQENSNCKIIELPEHITPDLYNKLFSLFYPNLPLDLAFTNKAFVYQAKMPLDSACLLMKYQALVGKNIDNFFYNGLISL